MNAHLTTLLFPALFVRIVTRFLYTPQASFFVAIVIVQWADLMVCKTRWLSIRTQGMINAAMNFGLFFETLLAAWLCYFPPINVGLGTRNLRLVHCFPAMPFSVSFAC